jgi:GT2 family glycosyltransferase
MKMKERIDVIFLHTDTFLEEYALDNLIRKTTCDIGILSKKFESDSYADEMNTLISISDAEYIVVFSSNMLVEDSWCEDLLYYSKKILDAGCVGIQSVENNKHKYKPLLTIDDDLKNVWVSDNNIVEGVFMFKKSLLTKEIGMFDKLFDKTGFEQAEFSLKLAFSGYNNFYIRKQSLVEMEIARRNEVFTKKTEFGTKLINEFVKANINFNHGE